MKFAVTRYNPAPVADVLNMPVLEVYDRSPEHVAESPVRVV